MPFINDLNDDSTVVRINWTGANIRIMNARNVNATQIGGTINNYGVGSAESVTHPSEGAGGNSMAIGVASWSDYGVDWERVDLDA